jgi:upstream activation factor subunit UAF30
MDPDETVSIPSDAEIKSAVFEWLAKVDASAVTKKDLKRQLESSRGWDLETKRTILSESLMEYFEKNIDNDESNERPLTDIETPVTDETEEVEVEEEEEGEGGEEIDPPVQTRKRKAGAGGFQVPVQLSTKLSDFLDGEIVLPRPEVGRYLLCSSDPQFLSSFLLQVTKRIWNYIKEHNLQNPKNRREILCDPKLEELLGRKKIDMFKMTKVLSEVRKLDLSVPLSLSLTHTLSVSLSLSANEICCRITKWFGEK